MTKRTDLPVNAIVFRSDDTTPRVAAFAAASTAALVTVLGAAERGAKAGAPAAAILPVPHRTSVTATSGIALVARADLPAVVPIATIFLLSDTFFLNIY